MRAKIQNGRRLSNQLVVLQIVFRIRDGHEKEALRLLLVESDEPISTESLMLASLNIRPSLRKLQEGGLNRFGITNWKWFCLKLKSALYAASR